MRRRRIKQDSSRRGAATIELAVCLPILVLVLFGTIETCNMIYTRQSLEIAAYEAVRTALIPGAVTENVTAQAELILNSRRVNAYNIQVDPSPDAAEAGDPVSVTITASADANNFVRPWFFKGHTLTGDAQMMKEF